MATISLLSAKGSPGVTTAAVGVALAWSAAHPGRSALVLDADPLGGDIAAGVLRGGAPPRAGVLPLATARGMHPLDALDAAAVDLRADGCARVIPGVPDEARAAALPLAWDVLASVRAALHRGGTDVLVDAGRLDRAGLGAPWLADSDLALMLVRPTLPSVTAAHRFAAAWPLPGVPLHLLLVAAPAPYRASEVADAVGVALLGRIPFDPAGARVHSEGIAPARGFQRGGYARGLLRAAGDLGALAIGRADQQLLGSGVDAEFERGDPAAVPAEGLG